ncbi:DnaB-like helicase C-terminal domain-containing protein, partial [Achromobacter insuavis]
GKPFAPGPSERMSVADLDRAMDFLEDHFTFMMPEAPTLDALLEQASRLVTRKGIRGLIMDPWNEIEHGRAAGQTETEYISLALSQIRKFCRAHDVHAWVVAHPAKLYKDKDSGDYPIPTPYDVSGSAHWRNKADNCITVYRHVKDENKPVEIHVQKIRKKFVGRVGMVELHYDRVTGRYQDYAHFTRAPIYSMQSRGAA